MDQTAVVPAPVKSGFFTSEFLLHLIQQLAGAAIACGLVPETGRLGQAIGAVLVIITTVHWGYIRTNLKTVAIQAGMAALKAVADAAKAGDGDVTPPTPK